MVSERERERARERETEIDRERERAREKETETERELNKVFKLYTTNTKLDWVNIFKPCVQKNKRFTWL